MEQLFFWTAGTESDGKLRAMVANLEEDQWSALDEAKLGPIDGGSQSIPSQFKTGTAYRLATRVGVVELELTGFEVRGHPFHGDPTLFLVFDGGGSPHTEGLVVSARGPELAKLTQPQPDAGLAAAYEVAYENAAAAFAGTQQLEAAGPRVFPARLPRPHQVLVVMICEIPDPDTFGEIAAGLVVGHHGETADFPHEPGVGSSYPVLSWFVDVGRDGVDDLVVVQQDNHDDANATYWLYVWEGAGLTAHQLQY